MMLKHLMFVIVFFSLFTYSYAAEFDWPDANAFTYPEYEIKILKDFDSNLQKAIKSDCLIDFIINYKPEFTDFQNKLFTIGILNQFIDSLNAQFNVIYSGNSDYDKFISEYEKSIVFDDETSWKKILVWVLLHPGSEDLKTLKNEGLDQLYQRRHLILEGIIGNNKKFAPIASYIEYVVDVTLITPKVPEEIIQNEISAIEKFANNFPGSEFSKYSQIELSGLYINKNMNEKAIKTCEKIIKENQNIYLCNSDLYSDAYVCMLSAYKNLGDKEKVKYFLPKIKQNIHDYKSTISFFSEYIKN